jgi:hypothetical protein
MSEATFLEIKRRAPTLQDAYDDAWRAVEAAKSAPPPPPFPPPAIPPPPPAAATLGGLERSASGRDLDDRGGAAGPGPGRGRFPEIENGLVWVMKYKYVKHGIENRLIALDEEGGRRVLKKKIKPNTIVFMCGCNSDGERREFMYRAFRAVPADPNASPPEFVAAHDPSAFQGKYPTHQVRLAPVEGIGLDEGPFYDGPEAHLSDDELRALPRRVEDYLRDGQRPGAPRGHEFPITLKKREAEDLLETLVEAARFRGRR